MKNKIILAFVILLAASPACSFSGQNQPSISSPTAPSAATFTEIPPTTTFTPIPTITPIPETIVFDFAAQLCNAKWMNGGQKFASCPDPSSDHSAGYAVLLDPATEGLPAGTPVLLTIPAWNGFAALFLRYPALTVQAGDHFRATLRCQTGTTDCDVEFALEYYDSSGTYHSPFASWKQNSGMPPTHVDYDLSALAGQNVDFVLILRPNNNTPQLDLGLWIAPQIYRVGP
jgi:hypothetical protein